jgi:outer membrane protein
MSLNTIKNGLGSLVTAFAMVTLVGVAPAAQAQETSKVGFVSLERILRDSAAAKAAQTKLEAEFAKRSKDLQDLANRLKPAIEKLEKDGAIMSDTERTRRQREVSDQDKEFQRKQREFNEDLNQRRNEELASIVERANRVIKQISEAEKFDVVVQEAVYVNPRIDMTERVIRALNSAK